MIAENLSELGEVCGIHLGDVNTTVVCVLSLPITLLVVVFYYFLLLLLLLFAAFSIVGLESQRDFVLSCFLLLLLLLCSMH